MLNSMLETTNKPNKFQLVLMLCQLLLIMMIIEVDLVIKRVLSLLKTVGVQN